MKYCAVCQIKLSLKFLSDYVLSPHINILQNKDTNFEEKNVVVEGGGGGSKVAFIAKLQELNYDPSVFHHLD